MLGDRRSACMVAGCVPLPSTPLNAFSPHPTQLRGPATPLYPTQLHTISRTIPTLSTALHPKPPFTPPQLRSVRPTTSLTPFHNLPTSPSTPDPLQPYPTTTVTRTRPSLHPAPPVSPSLSPNSSLSSFAPAPLPVPPVPPPSQQAGNPTRARVRAPTRVPGLARGWARAPPRGGVAARSKTPPVCPIRRGLARTRPVRGGWARGRRSTQRTRGRSRTGWRRFGWGGCTRERGRCR